MDLPKLKELHNRINQEALKEIYEELPDALIKVINNNTLNYCLQTKKFGLKEDVSSRVINNWVKAGVLKIDDTDKGKNRRFNKIECVWLNIIVESRKFGISLQVLEQARKMLLDSPKQNFSLLKFAILETILRKPKVILIMEEGHSNVMSKENYYKWESKGLIPFHINFNLLSFIEKEYPQNAFDIDFEIKDAYENTDKIKLLYFLKTGDYQYIKIQLSEGDIRIIENSNSLINNTALLKKISNWDFQKIEIIIDDEAETTIIQKP